MPRRARSRASSRADARRYAATPRITVVTGVLAISPPLPALPTRPNSTYLQYLLAAARRGAFRRCWGSCHRIGGMQVRLSCRAEVQQVTLFAKRLARLTDGSPVIDECVRERQPVVLREERHHILLDLDRILALAQAEAAREPADVRVHDDTLHDAVGVAHHDVGGLACHTGQRDELVHRAWHLAAEALDDQVCRRADALRLVAVEAGLLDVLLQLLQVGARVVRRAAILLEESLRHGVDTLVGALGREDGGDEQLQRRGEIERAGGIGIICPQDRHDRARPPPLALVRHARVRHTGNPLSHAALACAIYTTN